MIASGFELEFLIVAVAATFELNAFFVVALLRMGLEAFHEITGAACDFFAAAPLLPPELPPDFPDFPAAERFFIVAFPTEIPRPFLHRPELRPPSLKPLKTTDHWQFRQY